MKCSDYEGVYTSGYARVSVNLAGNVKTSVTYCSSYEGVCHLSVTVDRPEYVDDNYDYYYEDQYGNKYVYYYYNDSISIEIECEYARDVLYLTFGRSLKENSGGGDKPRNYNNRTKPVVYAYENYKVFYCVSRGNLLKKMLNFN